MANLCHQPRPWESECQRDDRRNTYIFGIREARSELVPLCAGGACDHDGTKVTYTSRSRGPSSSTNSTDCQVPRTSLPAETGTARDGPRIDEAM